MPRSGPPEQQIGYKVHAGPDGAPPLFLLHGLTASSAAFSANIESLQKEFTVVTVDLLGHGESDVPEAVEPYGPEAAVARITGLMDELGYDQVMLCGHSLGGALALRVALDAPDRVAALAILNSNSAAGTPEWRRRAAAYMHELATRVRAEGTGFLRETSLYPAAGRRLPEGARALLARDFDRLEPAGVAGTALGLASAVNAYERLGELQVPLLVMIGDRDQDFVRSCIDFLDQLPPDLTSWITIEGAGHAANLEQPEQFEAALIEFARDAEYLPVAAAPPSLATGGSGSRNNTALSVVGGALIAAGVIMVAGAFFVGRNNGNGGNVIPASNDNDPTATVVESVSGARTPGPEFVTATPASTATSTAGADEPTATATETAPEPTATTVQPIVVDTPVPEDTPTSAPPPPDTPTPTPSGPYAAMTGPSTGSVGDTASFISVSAPGSLKVEWSGCNPGINPNACSLPLTQPGCVLITLVAYYAPPDGAKVANQYIAVGDGTTCP